LLAGLVIGNATATGNGQHNHVVLPTQHRPFALWVHDELGWLSHGVRRVEPDEKRPQYRVRTHAHHALDRYREWYGIGGKRIPEDVALTPPVARAWYACDGGLEWRRKDSPPQITFPAAVDDRREDIARLLREAGYDPNVYERRVRLSVPETERFVGWIGDPVPGVEHRWMRDRTVARRLRAADASAAMERGEWYRELLALVTEALDIDHERLTTDRFDEAVASPSAAAIADWLGGGSWDDAKRVAGVRTTDTADCSAAEAREQALAEARKHRTVTYDERACRHALQRVADRRSTDQLSTTEYDRSRRDAEPSAATVITTLSDGPRRWSDALAAVGLSVASPGGGPQYTDEDCERALTKAHADIGDPLTKSAYREWATDRPAPAPGTIAGRLGDGYWAVAIERAGYEAGWQGRTGPQ
jgi:hypothetical protein